MNLNKFLVNSEALEPINSQFSGIFKRTVVTKESDLNKFLTPKSISNGNSNFLQHKSSDYEESFLKITRTLNSNYETEAMKQISRRFSDGKMTYQRNSSNDIKVIHYNLSELKLINHHCNLSPEALGLSLSSYPSNTTVKKRVGRPKNEDKLAYKKEILPYHQSYDLNHRTKSGRIIKFTQGVDPSIFSQSSEPVTPFFYEPIKPSEIQVQVPVPNEFLSLKEPPKKQRQISAQFRCSSCKKIYLGKSKMNNHYKNFPNHRTKSGENESNLFLQLMNIVREKKTNREMATVFFQEISSFVSFCEKLTPKLITNQDNVNTHQQIIDKNAASLLRINPGNYKINMNVFDKNFKLDNPTAHEPEMDESLESLDDEEKHTADEEKLTAKPLIIIDDVPSLDGNECSSLLIKANELTNLTNISLETEDF